MAIIKEGKILSLRAGTYLVQAGADVYRCKARGLFRHQNISPVVGDDVKIELQAYHEGYILAVLKRKNYLNRPRIANIDLGLIITSFAEPKYSYYLIDKFLAIFEHLKIEPIICVTKTDLASAQQEFKAAFVGYQNDGYKVVYTNVEDVTSYQDLKTLLKTKVSVLVGQSGAGKSSLLNAIDPELELSTNEISTALNRGKHTTRHVEIYETALGLIADSPGFSSLDLDMMNASELAVSYHDFAKASQECKFKNCLHINEPQCKVKELVAANKISPSRYENYLLFQDEIKNRKVKY